MIAVVTKGFRIVVINVKSVVVVVVVFCGQELIISSFNNNEPANFPGETKHTVAFRGVDRSSSLRSRPA